MTFRSFRTVAAAFAMAAPLLLAQTPAHAASAGTVVGTGTISPGVPATGCVTGAQVNFSGTGVLAGTNGFAPGPYNVRFDGNSTSCESIDAGAGVGQLSGDVAGTVTYTRVTGAILLSGNVTIAGRTVSLTAECTVVVVVNPASPLPITDFSLVCVIGLQP